MGEVESSSSFMEDKSIMIVPLLSGSGMRVKIIEAFTNMKAVVSTNTGASGISAINGMQILIADEPGCFVKSVVNLVRDKDLFNEL